ncbi:MAG: DNA-binding protein [Pseudomonadota bacterium]
MENVNELLKKPFLSEKEVAAITGRAVSTLRNERHLRRGFPYLKIGRRSVRYKLTDILTSMESRRISFTDEQ